MSDSQSACHVDVCHTNLFSPTDRRSPCLSASEPVSLSVCRNWSMCQEFPPVHQLVTYALLINHCVFLSFPFKEWIRKSELNKLLCTCTGIEREDKFYITSAEKFRAAVCWCVITPALGFD